MDIYVEICECISQVHVLRDCHEDNINNWLLIDTNDPGYSTFSDDEIVHNVVEESDTEGEENYLTEGEHGPSHSEAFDALDLAFKWFKRQEESNTTWLLQLRRNWLCLKKSTIMASGGEGDDPLKCCLAPNSCSLFFW